jgi:hypothetical protein
LTGFPELHKNLLKIGRQASPAFKKKVSENPGNLSPANKKKRDKIQKKIVHLLARLESFW